MGIEPTSAVIMILIAGRNYLVCRQTGVIYGADMLFLDRDCSGSQIDREVSALARAVAKEMERMAPKSRAAHASSAQRLRDRVRDYLIHLVASRIGKGGARPVWEPVLSGLDFEAVADMAIQCGWESVLRSHRLSSALKIMGRRLATRVRSGALGIAQETPWVADEVETMRMGAPLWNALFSTGVFQRSYLPAEAGFKDVAVISLSELGKALCAELVTLDSALTRRYFQPMLVSPKPWLTFSTGAYVCSEMSSLVKLIARARPSTQNAVCSAIVAGTMQPTMDALNSIQSVPLRINHDALMLREFVWEKGIQIEGVTPMRSKLEVAAEPPADIDQWEPRDRRAYFERQRKAKRINMGVVPNMMTWASDTQEARKLADANQTFYLPHKLDFRGRFYPVPSLSHHRNEATKSLMEFANGYPLGPDGLFWLKVHVANCGDFEKVSKKPFGARVAWVDDHMAEIEDMVDFPHASRLWADADSPFSFFAAAKDMVKAIRSGDPENYVSHIPVALDGSNSGVQHYSAAQRAPEGRYVCLTNDDPQDLYNEVAKICFGIAQREASGLTQEEALAVVEETSRQIASVFGNAREMGENPDDPSPVKLSKDDKALVADLKKRREGALADLWVHHGITRSLVKRPTMTYGYSAVAFGFGEQIMEDFMSPLSLKVMQGEMPSHPFGQTDGGKAAASYLGKIVFRAVEDTLPNVAAAMRWLKKAAQVLASEGHGVKMVTPTGFPLVMVIPEVETKRSKINLIPTEFIKTIQLGRAIDFSEIPVVQDKLTLHVELPGTVSGRSMQSGVSPNVIHACDAAHLVLTVNEMADAGVADMLVIHDSFAACAGNCSLLSATLREQMVELYRDWNPLQDIYYRALDRLSPEGRDRLEPPPSPGDLDIQQIREALYAFA